MFESQRPPGRHGECPEVAPSCTLVYMFPALMLASALLAPLSPGEHAVGFRMVVETDVQRTGLAPAIGMGRQIPIAIWYPAQTSAGNPLRLRDYVVTGAQALIGTAPADLRAPIDAFAAEALTRGVARAEVERLLDAAGIAVREAPAAAGRFPLLLFAHGSVESESVMCEYLASYGYVIAAVRSRGASDPVYKLSRENLDAVVADNDFVASRMLREADVANSPIGVIGMSNGAIVAMALQLRRPVGAIVSLDGGIGENAGGTYLGERSGGNVAALRAPLLHFYAPNNPHLNLEHLRSYHSSPRTLVFVRNMRHADFLAYPAFEQVLPGFSGPDVAADAHDGFVWVNRYTLHFLDAHLRNSKHGARFMAREADASGVPHGLLTMERLP
jgi:dienelactone hydrolase